MNFKIYLAINALSNTGIKRFMKSPCHYQYFMTWGSEPTTAQELGSLFHLAVLEPDRYLTDVTIYDEGIRRGKKWDEFQKANEGKTIARPDDVETVKLMADSITCHDTASGILQGAQFEFTVMWNDPAYGFACKARPDILRPDLGIIADLKSCQDAGPDSFMRDIQTFGYDIQAAWYLSGLQIAFPGIYNTFLFICTEKKPPYLTAVYNAQFLIQSGADKIKPVLAQYAECLKTNTWPGYPDKIIDLII